MYYKLRSCRDPLFEYLVGGSTPPLSLPHPHPPAERVGAHYVVIKGFLLSISLRDFVSEKEPVLHFYSFLVLQSILVLLEFGCANLTCLKRAYEQLTRT